jgi:hypothetical protein
VEAGEARGALTEARAVLNKSRQGGKDTLGVARFCNTG